MKNFLKLEKTRRFLKSKRNRHLIQIYLNYLIKLQLLPYKFGCIFFFFQIFSRRYAGLWIRIRILNLIHF